MQGPKIVMTGLLLYLFSFVAEFETFPNYEQLVKDYSPEARLGQGIRLFITQEPLNSFCTPTMKREGGGNQSSSICLSDPPTTHLLVNWDCESEERVDYPGSNWDWVGLYQGFPEDFEGRPRPPSPIEWQWTSGRSRGSTGSAAIFGQQLRVNLTLSATTRATTHPRRCLPFYAAYHRWSPAKHEYDVAAINCLRIYPDWMERSWPYISRFRLHEILIPGTHDSGSATMLDVLASPFTRTQSLGIYTQLLRGVRYLDIRVGRDPQNPAAFIIVHNVFWADTSIESLLDDVTRFLTEYPREFVILDFHHFLMGMTEKSHFRDLHELIVNKLGELWIPREDRHRSLGELLARNKRAIVAFECSLHVLCSLDELNPKPWDGIPHVWPNTRSLVRMKKLISDETTTNHKEIWVSQPILTPVSLVTNIHRRFTQIDWLNMNIVATDFFQSNILPELAMEINERRWRILRDCEA